MLGNARAKSYIDAKTTNTPPAHRQERESAHIAVVLNGNVIFQNLAGGPNRSQSITTYVVAKVENVANRPGLGRLTSP